MATKKDQPDEGQRPPCSYLPFLKRPYKHYQAESDERHNGADLPNQMSLCVRRAN